MTSNNTVAGIDTHAHVFKPDLPMVAGRRYAPTYSASVADYLAHLDRHGLSHGVLVQPSFLGTDNRYLVDTLAAHAGRLRGVAVIAPDAPDAQLDELAAGGVAGVRLNLVGQTLPDYRAEHWQQFFKRVARYGWFVEIQRRLEDFAQIVPPIRAAGATVLIDHFGLPDGAINVAWPAHREFLDLLGDAGVWIKLSAAYRCNATIAEAQDSLAAIRVAAGGLERAVWGSDWPHTRYEDVTGYAEQWAALTALIPDPAECHQVLVTNPCRLFRLDHTTTRNASC